MTPAEILVQAVDDAAAGRVVVTGSLPPNGRDLDVLVRDEDLPTIALALERLGAIRRDDTWVLFRDCTAFAVELTPASSWRIPREELEALFAAAEIVRPYRWIARPSAAHSLLLLARIGITHKRVPRLREALDEPGARAAAEEHAAAWGVDLTRLEARPHARPPIHAPQVVALSGLDGSGKSTQANALAAALEALGYRVYVEWAPILQNRSIEFLSHVARKALRTMRSSAAPVGGASIVAQAEAASVRRRLLRGAWTTFVAAVNGFSLRRPALRRRGRSTVVIHDRFVLDSIVRLRFLYGSEEPLGFQRRVLRALAPQPAAAFWLDVPAHEAYVRKPEHWNEEQLARQRVLYEEECDRLGVRRLAGERPPEELAREIATGVWLRLRA